MARQADRSAKTRAALIAAATACFVERGFAETSLDAVVQRGGTSKGALYHHFGNKAELLQAVFEHVSRDCIAQARLAGEAETGPRARIAGALKAWLRAALRPVPRRILLEIGPAVLGFARARAIEQQNSQRLMIAAIESGRARRKPAGRDSGLVAGLLNAAVAELALSILAEGGAAAPGKLHLQMIDRLVDALVSAK